METTSIVRILLVFIAMQAISTSLNSCSNVKKTSSLDYSYEYTFIDSINTFNTNTILDSIDYLQHS